MADGSQVLENQSKVPIFVFIGESDWDLLPNFLKHYRALGVTDFHIAAHRKVDQRIKGFIDSHDDIHLDKVIHHDFTENLKISALTEMAKKYAQHWCFIVDADEFVELPFDSLASTISCLESLAMTSLPAVLLQRFHESGKLVALPKEKNISKVYSHFDYSLCERMGLKHPAWKTKYPLAFVTSNFSVERGQHFPPNQQADGICPIRGVVHHFKWRRKLLKAFLEPRGKDTNWREMDVYRKWYSVQGLLPVEGAEYYSRKKMFELAFLVQPSSRQLAVYQMLGDVRQSTSSVDKLMDVGKLRNEDENHQKLKTDYERRYPHLFTQKKYKICFVTQQVFGPDLCGGIGTAISSLVELLSFLGHRVEIIYTSYLYNYRLSSLWVEQWKSRGVLLTNLSKKNVSSHGTYADVFKRKVADYAESKDYDLIHFDDTQDYLDTIYLRKYAGLSFRNTKLILTTHGNTKWHFEGNNIPWHEGHERCDSGLSLQLRLADLVLHPSGYMKGLLKHRVKDSVPQKVIPNMLYPESRSFFDKAIQTKSEFQNLVFLGRIETRKGLRVFIDGINGLSINHRQKIGQVVLMGKLGEHLKKSEVLSQFKIPLIKIKLIDNLGSGECLNYLRSNQCLVVIPSLQDNLPYTVYECLENQIPMITTNIGGIPELIHQDDVDRITFEPTADGLAKKLQKAMDHGFLPGRLAFDADEAVLNLVNTFHEVLQRTHKIDEGDFDQSLDEIVYSSQRFAPLEDVHSSYTEKLSAFGGKTYELEDSSQQFRDLHRLVEHSSSQYLILRARGTTIQVKDRESLLTLMVRSGADAVVADYRLINAVNLKTSRTIYAPASPAIYASGWSIYGAECALVKRQSLVDLCHPSHFPMKSPHYVWELLNEMVANGGVVLSLPAPIVTVDKETQMLNTYLEDSQFRNRLSKPWLKGIGSALQLAKMQKSIESDAKYCPYRDQALQERVSLDSSLARQRTTEAKLKLKGAASGVKGLLKKGVNRLAQRKR